VRNLRRFVAAALAGGAVAGLLVVGAPAAVDPTGGSAVAAQVTLQVAPRGDGAITVVPNGVQSDAQTCNDNFGEQSCSYSFEQHTRIQLTATPNSGTFFGWSSPDCPGTGACSFTLDEQTSVVGLFNPIQVRVRIQYKDTGDGTIPTVSSPQTTFACEEDLDTNSDDVLGSQCIGAVAPGTRVSITAVPNGHSFKAWNPGCEPTNQQTCSIQVIDNPTWVGLSYDDAPAPDLATSISVRFQLRKRGNGAGSVTASKLDCGGTCSADYQYGDNITLEAKVGAGSVFDGWNGVCERTALRCSFPVGPITSITASFVRDAKPPTTPAGLAVATRTRTALELSWSQASDDVGVTGYRVYVDSAAAGDTTATRYLVSGLKCSRTYAIAVDAGDAAGNRSARATLSAATRPCPFAVRLVGVRVVRAGGNRTIVATVRVSRRTTARLKLVRKRATLRRGSYAVNPGTNVLRLRLPRSLRSGPGSLVITLVNPDGGTRGFTRGVLVPRP
jgi:hypothetical protein